MRTQQNHVVRGAHCCMLHCAVALAQSVWEAGAMKSLPLFLCALVSYAAASCQQITVELCRSTGYNFTGMPNLVGHDTQADAEFTLQTFSPLVQYGCSAQLTFFLCSVYIPMCNEKVSAPIGPCRGLCESVRARCYPVLQGFGFPWPVALDCTKFPAQNDHRHMCMEGPGEIGLGISPAKPVGRLPTPETDTSPCSQYARPDLYVRVNRTGRCIQLCDADILFTRVDKEIAEMWVIVLSAICFVTSLFATLTFLFDSSSRNSHFPYPERPLPFLALCYSMVSVGWGVRAALGREAVACYPDTDSSLLSQGGLGNANCALVFFLTYYFGNAIAMWWIILITCWFLSLGLGWTHDRIQSHAPLFHLLSWGLPACLTITVLTLRSVDADELTGICSVGNHNTDSQLLLVVLPQFVCLAVGSAMLLIALTSPSSWGWSRRLLAALYLLPTAALLASHCYRYWGYDDWVLALAPSPAPRYKPHALLWAFLLPCLTSLTVGSAISLCICLPKSAQTWKNIFCPDEIYKKSTLKHIKVNQNSFYYYEQPRIHRVHRSHRKHKSRNGSETLV